MGPVRGGRRRGAGRARTRRRRIEGTISSSVPVGAGLSSSAALELALVCQEAELVATRVSCGIMDQLTSVSGVAGHALLIDCRSLEVRPIPIPAGVAVLVVHSGVERQLVDSAYAEWRAACEAVAARLGVRALRDATPEQVADDPRAPATSSPRTSGCSPPRTRSRRATPPRSARSSPHETRVAARRPRGLDTRARRARGGALEEAGALGARLTGAGFGGCAVALRPRPGRRACRGAGLRGLSRRDGARAADVPLPRRRRSGEDRRVITAVEQREAQAYTLERLAAAGSSSRTRSASGSRSPTSASRASATRSRRGRCTGFRPARRVPSPRSSRRRAATSSTSSPTRASSGRRSFPPDSALQGGSGGYLSVSLRFP